MGKIRNFIIPLTLVGAVTLLPKVLRTKDVKKKKGKIHQDIKNQYDIDEDNLFIWFIIFIRVI